MLRYICSACGKTMSGVLIGNTWGPVEHKCKNKIMKKINEINTDEQQGKLLLAAIAKITTKSQTNKTPNQVLGQLNKLSKKMFKPAS